MDAKQLISSDEMLQRTLMTFLETQATMFQETMRDENEHIASVQARYEVGAMALAVVAQFCNRVPIKTQLEGKWAEALGTVHDLICETGDEYLRSKGIEPPN